MKATLVVLLAVAGVTALAIVWGAQHARVALTNREPTHVTCAELSANPPDAAWLIVSDCEPDLDGIMVERGSDAVRASNMYIPLRPKSDPTMRAPVVVKIHFGIDPPQDADDDDLDKLARVDQDIAPAVLKRVTRAFEHPVEGVVRSGLDLDRGLDTRAGDEKSDLSKLGVGLTPSFVVLDRDAKPQFWFAIFVLAVGAGGLGVLAFMLRRMWRA